MLPTEANKQLFSRVDKYLPFMAGTIYLILILLSKGTTDSGDGVMHYLISKSAIHHHYLFYDHWGKPFFTLCSTAFSQFGYKGICFFNGLCIVFSAFLTQKICAHLFNFNSAVPFILTLFTPVLFSTGFTGLTEPLFSLVLSAGVYLLIRNKIIAGCILLSFLPFVRTEGFMLLPVFYIFLLAQKEWLKGFWLSFGTIFYSLAGSTVFGTIFWVIKLNPYKGAKELYGSGPLFHFVSNTEKIFGIAFAMLFIAGLITLLTRKKKIETTTNKRALIILVLGSFATYYIAHSIFWWKGIVGSLGLFRVMAGVTPMAAVISSFGVLGILSLNINGIVKKSLLAFIIGWHVYQPIKLMKPPIRPDEHHIIMQNIGKFVEENNLSQRRFCYGYPLLSVVLNKDHFNIQEYIDLQGLEKTDPVSTLNVGDIVIWDSHFGKESNRKLAQFMDHPSMKLLKHYKKEIYGSAYEVYVMEKIEE